MKPFLKWPGNKFTLLERIKNLLPEGKRLIEPFSGSAAVFLNTNYKNYLIADSNKDLINLFQYVQTEGMNFIGYAKQFFTDNYNNESSFYQFRTYFNTTVDKRLKAALFLYLNRHAYNGLCRYNASGMFNVPFGRYKAPYFPERELLNFHQKSQLAKFSCADFQTIMAQAQRGDVIYCDPPYIPLSNTAQFTAYQASGFSLEQQISLVKLAEELALRGIPVVISNHHTEWARKLYHKAQLTTFSVQRYISCKGQKRELAPELLALFI